MPTIDLSSYTVTLSSSGGYPWSFISIYNDIFKLVKLLHPDQEEQLKREFSVFCNLSNDPSDVKKIEFLHQKTSINLISSCIFYTRNNDGGMDYLSNDAYKITSVSVDSRYISVEDDRNGLYIINNDDIVEWLNENDVTDNVFVNGDTLVFEDYETAKKFSDWWETV